jgi:hypothetical protein
MTTTHSLRFVVSIGLPFRWFPPCRRACRAGAFPSHLARHPATSSPVQTACPERAMPKAWRTLAGGHAARCAASPMRRRPERQRRSKAQGKIKGRGTPWREKAVCTWGWRGTRQGKLRAARVRNVVSALAKSRATRAGLRWSWKGVAA